MKILASSVALLIVNLVLLIARFVLWVQLIDATLYLMPKVLRRSVEQGKEG